MKTCNKKFQENKLQNKTLLESQNFRVITSIGAIVEGWVLLIPKKHFISFSEMDDNLLLEAEKLSEKIYLLLNKTYQCEIVSFENGANSYNNKIGCGVDYAHIHFVPIKINLKRIIESEYKNDIKWDNIYSLNKINEYRDSSYFYIKTNQKGLITFAPSPKSQIIRKGIAKAVGIPNKFDWKKYPFKINVINTINKLQSIRIKENDYTFA